MILVMVFLFGDVFNGFRLGDVCELECLLHDLCLGRCQFLAVLLGRDFKLVLVVVVSVAEPEADRGIVLLLDEREQLALAHIRDKSNTLGIGIVHFLEKFFILLAPPIHAVARQPCLLARDLNNRNFYQFGKKLILKLILFHRIS